MWRPQTSNDPAGPSGRERQSGTGSGQAGDGVRQTPRTAWPELESLRLAAEDAEQRRAGIGGSDANIILSGDRARVHQLWLEKRGECDPPNLDDNLAVVLGCWTEAFNRQWYQRCTGERVIHVGPTRTCEKRPWRRCTLDGMVERRGAVWEAKHTNAFAKEADLLERYMPQLQHNMAVTGCDRAVLSVIYGNHRYEVIEIAADWLYQLELLDAEERFWAAVCEGTEPPAVEAPKVPRPIGVREVCLEGSNAWAAAAADWLQHREAAKRHSAACATLKELVEGDVARAFGHGVEARRNKSGAISIRELAQ